jgi:hypothetical protein
VTPTNLRAAVLRPATPTSSQPDAANEPASAANTKAARADLHPARLSPKQSEPKTGASSNRTVHRYPGSGGGASTELVVNTNAGEPPDPQPVHHRGCPDQRHHGAPATTRCVTSLALHVLAASASVGGLTALLLLRRTTVLPEGGRSQWPHSPGLLHRHRRDRQRLGLAEHVGPTVAPRPSLNRRQDGGGAVGPRRTGQLPLPSGTDPPRPWVCAHRWGYAPGRQAADDFPTNVGEIHTRCSQQDDPAPRRSCRIR